MLLSYVCQTDVSEPMGFDSYGHWVSFMVSDPQRLFPLLANNLTLLTRSSCIAAFVHANLKTKLDCAVCEGDRHSTSLRKEQRQEAQKWIKFGLEIKELAYSQHGVYKNCRIKELV
ncbi:hypothetical protein LIER_41582 [Lithospermum erythrorhizon]|uniref:Uncharacterized protein n=1 Tax=Lithospermum erythrorhizon TaxID=34254 RepID=A0AAV3RD68_LITER